MESNLALPHLYYSTLDLSGSFSFAFRKYIATSVRPGGTPNHLLVNLLILASIASTVVERISLIRSDQRSLGISMNCRHHFEFTLKTTSING